MKTYFVKRIYSVEVGAEIEAETCDEADNIMDKKVETLKFKSIKGDGLRIAWYLGYSKFKL